MMTMLALLNPNITVAEAMKMIEASENAKQKMINDIFDHAKTIKDPKELSSYLSATLPIVYMI
jgi:hypothetical protein